MNSRAANARYFIREDSCYSWPTTVVPNCSPDNRAAIHLVPKGRRIPAGGANLVTDNETSEQPKLTFTVDPSSIAENGGSATARIERTGPTTAAIAVALVSSDTTEATVPASIVIPAGVAFGTFTVTAVDDSLVDGTQTVVLTATSTGLTEGTATIAVTDNETPGLTLTLNPTTISERDGRSTATLQRSGPTTASLEVTLTSSDVSEATATFVVTAVDDALLDGQQSTVLSATAVGLRGGSQTL
ncbi:MAG: hypothetical protein IT423_07865 [Pirellulaceae bacterium]|nr:hypothetical protein [Pirellulaceae bacterium]